MILPRVATAASVLIALCIPALAQDMPPADVLRAIVPQLERKPAPTDIVFRPQSGMTPACSLRPFDMILRREENPVRTYSVMLDDQRPKQLLAVLTRITVDADGSARAYHPEDPDGRGICTLSPGPDGKDKPKGICALDRLSSGRMALFRGSEKMTKDNLVRYYNDIWPLIRDEKLTPVDLTKSYGSDAPEGYYFFHSQPHNLTAFFKRFIVPQTKKGYPCRHGKESEFPGYFVAATTLEYKNPARDDGCAPTRYIDAEQVPFFVLPKGGFGQIGIGDVIVARAKIRGIERVVFGIIADAGPPGQLGEGSIAFNAALLGRPDTPVLSMKGTDALDISGPRVAIMVLGGTRDRLKGDYSRKNVEDVARGELARWGGADPWIKFDACVAAAKVNKKCDALRDQC